MSLILSLYLVGGLGGLVGEPAAGEPFAAASFSQAAGKKPRRSPRRAAPATSAAPDTPPLDDLPLGAQDLLPASARPADAGAAGKPSRADAPRPLDNNDFGAPRRAGAESGPDGEPAETEPALSPEDAWRRALEEARNELREAQAEQQRQENADNPPPPGQDATLRVTKARESLQRLLDEGKAKQYREQP